MFRALARMFARPRVAPAFREALRQLGPGDVVIDAGANVGAYTLMMARTGAEVHAFEPDPVAYRQLARRVGHLPNVILYQVALGDRNRNGRLYLHQDRKADPVGLSQSSSLLAGKGNVDPGNFVDVDVVRFSDMVVSLDQVALLKMDIEGGEIAALNDLLDHGLGERIERAFVELHDRKNPALAIPTAALRARLADFGGRYDLTWH